MSDKAARRPRKTPASHPAAPGEPAPPRSAPSLDDYPVREYVAAMAAELAGMARWDGDERLAGALDAAVNLARQGAPPS